MRQILGRTRVDERRARAGLNGARKSRLLLNYEVVQVHAGTIPRERDMNLLSGTRGSCVNRPYAPGGAYEYSYSGGTCDVQLRRRIVIASLFLLGPPVCPLLFFLAYVREISKPESFHVRYAFRRCHSCPMRSLTEARVN